MVYVDDIYILKGQYRWCHLMSDLDDHDHEIHDFAQKIGLRAWWFHYDHYDVTENERRKAIEAGAVETTAARLVEIRRARRKREQALMTRGLRRAIRQKRVLTHLDTP